MRNSVWAIILLSILAAACAKPAEAPRSHAVFFKDDIDFLTKHSQVVVLSDEDGNAQVAVNPDLLPKVVRPGSSVQMIPWKCTSTTPSVVAIGCVTRTWSSTSSSRRRWR